MAWKEVLVMEERCGFVLLVEKRQQSFSSLCTEYGISRKTGYKCRGGRADSFLGHEGIGSAGAVSGEPDQRQPGKICTRVVGAEKHMCAQRLDQATVEDGLRHQFFRLPPPDRNGKKRRVGVRFVSAHQKHHQLENGEPTT